MTTNSIKFMAMAACVALSFVSCQNDIDFDKDQVFLTPEFQSSVMIQTRAMASGDYSAYAPQNGDKIQAWTYDAGHSEKYAAIRSGVFSYTTADGWKSTVGCESGHNIDIYSIMPAGIASASMSNNGVLNLDGLKILSDKDVLYSVAAAKTEPTLTKGNFHLNNVQLASSLGQEDKVWFAMNHLFAKANLKFQGDSEYLYLRTVAITGIVIETENATVDGSTIKFNNNAEVIIGDQFQNGHLEIEMELPEAQSPSGKPELTISPQDFGSFYFLPQAGAKISVTVYYDIYDWERYETRPGQKATAKNLIKLDNASLEAGKEYDITVTVKPSFLYVLSDNDGKLDLTIE